MLCQYRRSVLTVVIKTLKSIEKRTFVFVALSVRVLQAITRLGTEARATERQRSRAPTSSRGVGGRPSR